MEQHKLGRYQVLEEIASGGQATVYRAWDTGTGQIVALKVMHPHLVKDTTYLERFHREARLAASIKHPNVIRIFEVGHDGDSHFLSMEYLTLSVYDLIESQGQFPTDRAVDICYQTALALQSAHQHGIVHRDIKPQNILLAPDGTAKVADFGIARAEELSTMTRTGAIMGTPYYMAPEQAQGQRADVRSDLYSLGVVLYQMLTGNLPFNAETPWEVIRQHVEEQPTKVRRIRPDISRELEQVVGRCLEKAPDRRYQVPQELALALERAQPEATRPRRPQAAPKREVLREAPPAAPAAPKTRSVRRVIRRFVYGVVLLAVAATITAAGLRVAAGGGGKEALIENPIQVAKEIAVDVPVGMIRDQAMPLVMDRAVRLLKDEALLEMTGKAVRLVADKAGPAETDKAGPAETDEVAPAVTDEVAPVETGQVAPLAEVVEKEVATSLEPISEPVPVAATRDSSRAGQWVRGMAFDGEAIWVANGDDGTVTKLALDGGELGTFHVGRGSSDLAFDGDAIWVANRLDDTVTKLALNGEKLDTFSVGWDPGALVFDGEVIWVSHRDDTVTILARDGKELGIFPVGRHAAAMAFDGEAIWMADADHDSVTKLTPDGRAIGTFPVGREPHGLAFDGKSVWVANSADGTVTRLALDGSELDTFPIGRWPSDLAFDGETIWVTIADNNTVIKLAPDGSELHAFPVGSWPGNLAFDRGAISVSNLNGDGTAMAAMPPSPAFFDCVVDLFGYDRVVEFPIPGSGPTDQEKKLIRVKCWEYADEGEFFECVVELLGDERAREFFTKGARPTDKEGVLIESECHEVMEPSLVEATTSGSPSPGLRRGATISGRVIDVDTGQPIANVGIKADNGYNDGPNSRAETDADGRYVLQGLAPGTYRIRARADRRGYIQEFYDDNLDWDDANLVTINGADPVEVIDFGLKRGAAISGRVIDAATGLPIANMELKAGPIDGDHLSWARTRSNGNYTLRGLPAGLIEVSVHGQEYINQRTNIRISEAGLVRGANFELTRGAIISGRVTDVDSGLPIANVDIEADNSNEDGPNAWAETDADGRYILQGVAPGTYRIRARADRQGYIREFYGDNLDWDDADLVTVTGTELLEVIDFGLKRGAAIAGKVIDAETGLPIINIELNAGLVDGNHLSWTRTDSNGNYILKGLPAGFIEVSVHGQEYINQRRNIRLSEAGLVRGANFDLTRGATISGRVTDVDTGLPIANVDIEADNRNGDGPNAWADTDADGRYILQGVAPGTYRIRTRADWQGYIREFYSDKLDRDDADLVTITGTDLLEVIDFGLRRGAAISGRLIDAETGLPIANMELNAGQVDGGHVSWARTDSGGNYILRGLPDGLIEVSVQGQGYIEAHRTVTIRGGQDITGFDF